MWLRTSCEFSFNIIEPTPFILMLRPRSNAKQWVAREEYRISPTIPVYEFTDLYDNLCQRLVAPPGHFSIKTTADVRTSEKNNNGIDAPFVEIQDLPDSVIKYLMPSRYCESDRFNQMALDITNGETPGYNQVARIESWLKQNISYIPGSSNYPVSATEVNQKQSGVCRDLAHLGISLCRSISIPARMVVGYLHHLAPMDMHAWFEAYVGRRWYSFDAVRTATMDGYVSVGYGRDAADVAVYTQFGFPVYPLTQKVSVEEIDPVT
ncbi:MAG: transglutaminase family protein [Cyclobacteriaceae bacterium]